MPCFKELKITVDEAIQNYSDCLQFYQQDHTPCTSGAPCLYGGYHVGFVRESNGLLRSFSYECPYKQEYDTLQNYQNNFLIDSDVLKNHVQDMEQDNTNDIKELGNLSEEKKECALKNHKSLMVFFDKIKNYHKLITGA